MTSIVAGTKSSPPDSPSTSTSASNPDEKDLKRDDPDAQTTLLRRLWKVAAPYWYSDDKAQARLQLAAVFALTLGTTGISVGFNFLGRDFYNALASNFLSFLFPLLPLSFLLYYFSLVMISLMLPKKTRTNNNSRSNFYITLVPLLVEFR